MIALLPAPRLRGNRKTTTTPPVIYLPARSSSLRRMPFVAGVLGPHGAAMILPSGEIRYVEAA